MGYEDSYYSNDPKNERALAEARHRIETLTQRVEVLTDALIEVWSVHRPSLIDTAWVASPSGPGDVKFFALASEARMSLTRIETALSSVFIRLGLNPGEAGTVARARKERELKLEHAARLRAEAERIEKEVGR